MRPLEPAVVSVWMVKNGLVVAAFLAAAVIYDVTGWLGGAERALPTGTAILAVFVLGLAYAVAVPRLRFRFWRYALREEELLLERGIWNRVRTVVPLRRVQHLDVSQDVIEREYDLGKLVVHTAGTRANAVVLPGLAIGEAERLREEIKHHILEDTL